MDRMPDMRQISLELLEYKVSDLLFKRPVKGGFDSILELYEHIQTQRQDLNSEQLALLGSLSATILRYSDMPPEPAASTSASSAQEVAQEDVTEPAGLAAFGDLFTEEGQGQAEGLGGLLEIEASEIPSAYVAELNPEYVAERQGLQKLAQRSWWHHLRDRFYTMAVMYRQESERHTVRVLYATLRNLNAYSNATTFANDAHLENFVVLEPVPDYRDPLLSLNDTESITELILEVARLIMEFQDKRSPYRHVAIPQREVLNYVQQMATIIAADPYQGKMGLNQKAGANAAQIRLAIQELNRENLRPDVLREQTVRLQERLQEAVRFERAQRKMFDKDVQSYGEAVANFFARLAAILPQRVGGSGDPPTPATHVLFAADPLLATQHMDNSANTFTIKLTKPFRVNVAGVNVGLAISDNSMNLYIDGQGRPIFDDTVVYHEQRLANNQQVTRRISVFVHKNLLHVDISPLPRSLNRLIAEVMTVNFMMLPSQRHWISQTLQRITGIPSAASSQFARRSLRALLQQCLSSQQPQRYLKGILVAALRLERLSPDKEAMGEFVRLANLALTADQRELNEIIAGVNMRDTALFDLQGQEMVSFQYESMALSVKRYEKPASHYGEHLAVIHMGRVMGAFEEFMLQPLSKGMVLLARSYEQLATIYLPLEPEDRMHPSNTWG